MEQLSSPTKDKLKSDGTTIASWLSALASFCGFLYRKYSTTELAGLLQYLVNRLKDDDSLDLLVLKELIAKMGGIETVEEITDSQLEAQAGGDTLKGEQNLLVQSKNLKKPGTKLKDALMNNKLALPLLILIAQQRGNIIFHTDTSHLKLLGDLYDKVQIRRQLLLWDLF